MHNARFNNSNNLSPPHQSRTTTTCKNRATSQHQPRRCIACNRSAKQQQPHHVVTSSIDRFNESSSCRQRASWRSNNYRSKLLPGGPTGDSYKEQSKACRNLIRNPIHHHHHQSCQSTRHFFSSSPSAANSTNSNSSCDSQLRLPDPPSEHHAVVFGQQFPSLPNILETPRKKCYRTEVTLNVAPLSNLRALSSDNEPTRTRTRVIQSCHSDGRWSTTSTSSSGRVLAIPCRASASVSDEVSSETVTPPNLALFGCDPAFTCLYENFNNQPTNPVNLRSMSRASSTSHQQQPPQLTLNGDKVEVDQTPLCDGREELHRRRSVNIEKIAKEVVGCLQRTASEYTQVLQPFRWKLGGCRTRELSLNRHEGEKVETNKFPDVDVQTHIRQQSGFQRNKARGTSSCTNGELIQTISQAQQTSKPSAKSKIPISAIYEERNCFLEVPRIDVSPRDTALDTALRLDGIQHVPAFHKSPSCRIPLSLSLESIHLEAALPLSPHVGQEEDEEENTSIKPRDVSIYYPVHVDTSMKEMTIASPPPHLGVGRSLIHTETIPKHATQKDRGVVFVFEATPKIITNQVISLDDQQTISNLSGSTAERNNKKNKSSFSIGSQPAEAHVCDIICDTATQPRLNIGDNSATTCCSTCGSTTTRSALSNSSCSCSSCCSSLSGSLSLTVGRENGTASTWSCDESQPRSRPAVINSFAPGTTTQARRTVDTKQDEQSTRTPVEIKRCVDMINDLLNDQSLGNVRQLFEQVSEQEKKTILRQWIQKRLEKKASSAVEERHNAPVPKPIDHLQPQVLQVLPVTTDCSCTECRGDALEPGQDPLPTDDEVAIVEIIPPDQQTVMVDKSSVKEVNPKTLLTRTRSISRPRRVLKALLETTSSAAVKSINCDTAVGAKTGLRRPSPAPTRANWMRPPSSGVTDKCKTSTLLPAATTIKPNDSFLPVTRTLSKRLQPINARQTSRKSTPSKVIAKPSRTPSSNTTRSSVKSTPTALTSTGALSRQPRLTNNGAGDKASPLQNQQPIPAGTVPEVESQYEHVTDLKVYDALIKSHLAKSDRRIKAAALRSECTVEFFGPFRPSSTTEGKRLINRLYYYQCRVKGSDKATVIRCLGFLKDSFPNSCI